MKKYADVVRAYLDGAEVQVRSCEDRPWLDVTEPTWCNVDVEYRIKPKEPRIVEKYILVGFDGDHTHHTNGVWACLPKQKYVQDDHLKETEYRAISRIKMLCNEETGEVISVELIK